MPIVNKGSLATNLDINCKIDGKVFQYINAISYTHLINGGRRVVIDFIGHYVSEISPLGSRLTLKIGNGDTSHNLDFEGIIYQTTP